ncbi:MAG: MmcQ/YjbR family DNA-binding protein, partial [Tannerellaceae bacterium]|nr:MmcQ/YjbR family DNA-binding protein [Tannerellaceae bacterium]
HCLSKKGGEEDYKKEWDAIRYTVRGKMFAMVANDAQGRGIISVKHLPEHGEDLRERYEDIVPGYYMNKEHWSSVFLDGNVPGMVLKAMIDESYELVFRSLGKKVQAEILSR